VHKYTHYTTQHIEREYVQNILEWLQLCLDWNSNRSAIRGKTFLGGILPEI